MYVKIGPETESQYAEQSRYALNVSIHDAIHAAKDRQSWQRIVPEKVIQGGHDPQY